MRRIYPILLLALAGCGEAVQDNHFAEDVQEERPVSGPATIQAVPVRIGELGPNFPACNAVGVTRNLAAGETLAVREAPFETAAETGRIPAQGGFFICARSHDQKWFGVVFPREGAPASCGVSAPVPTRRDYEGPCGAGWVSSPFVKLTAGLEEPQQPEG